MINLRQDKKGVILVFTLILLSVLLSTALSFSYFVISDINKARAVDDSIIAYYAADSGIEESLYLLKKQELTESVNNLTFLRPQDGLLHVSGGSWNIRESTDYEKGVLRQRLSNGQSAKFFILNRGLAEDNSNLNKSKSITVEWLKGAGTAPKLQVILTQLWPQTKDGALIYYTDTSEVEVADSSLNNRGATCYNFKDIDLDGNKLGKSVDYLVEFKVLGSSNNDHVDRLIIKAYNASCSSIQDMEDLSTVSNETGITNITLKSKGVYGRSEQSIIAHLLPKDTVSGLLGFVLFSEQDITKE